LAKATDPSFEIEGGGWIFLRSGEALDDRLADERGHSCAPHGMVLLYSANRHIEYLRHLLLDIYAAQPALDQKARARVEQVTEFADRVLVAGANRVHQFRQVVLAGYWRRNAAVPSSLHKHNLLAEGETF
jgi:hypothetical protein